MSDPLPSATYEGEALVTADALTVQLPDSMVTFSLPGAVDLLVGDTVVLENPDDAYGGVEIYAAGRLVGYVGRLTIHWAPDEWTETVGSLEVELEPVCIRDNGSRSWCESGDEATCLVYAARIGGVVVGPGESRTGTIGTATATVRNRGINAQVDCEDTCIPLRFGQFGLDIAVQP